MPTDPVTLELPDPDATRRLGRALGAALEPGLVVALEGDLGAGKTALTKAAVSAQGEVEEDDVVSPTFTIAAEYPGRVETLHVDAYRLEDGGDFDALGFGALEESARATLVEWAERVADALPDDRLCLLLEHASGGRRATLRATGARGQRALETTLKALGDSG
jgi:tRNA threonylcarbamoyl adenosine modification protein YjeE